MYQDLESIREQYDAWPPEWQVGDELAGSAAGQTIALFKKHFYETPSTRPIFVFFNIVEPHFPYLPPPPFRGRFGGHEELLAEMVVKGNDMEQALVAGGQQVNDLESLVAFYDEELLYVDAVLGHFLDWLKSESLYDQSLIVVTSDHGEHLGEDGRYSHQLALSSELLWVPLIVKFPGNENAGLRVDDVVSSAGVYSTLLEAAGCADAPPSGSDAGTRAAPWRDDWSLAEYYYSNDYFDMLTAINPEFDRTVHQAVRRVVFTGRGSVEFRDQELSSTRSPDIARDLRTWLRHYTERIRQQVVRYRDVSDAGAAMEALRELGYVK